MEKKNSIQNDSNSQEHFFTSYQSNELPPASMINSNATMEMFEDSDESLNQTCTKKYKSKSKKGRKAQEFTLYIDQKILTLILKFGPKFKKISRLLNGKPVNIIKNRYYRHLRYKWDEILGDEYAFMNEKKEKVTLQNIWEDIPLVPEYSDILAKMMINIQSTVSKCLSMPNIVI